MAILQVEKYVTMNRIPSVLLVAAMLLLPHPSGAQKIELTNDFVTSVAVDSRGDIWVGTDEGLNRYDGIRSNSYYKHSSGLGSNQVNFVFADRERPMVWVASRYGGLNGIDCLTGEFTRYAFSQEDPGSLVNDDINYIDQDEQGNIWASSFAKGIEKLDFETGTFTHYNHTTLKDFRDKPLFVFKVRGDKLYVGHWDYGLSIVSLTDGSGVLFQHSPDDPSSLPSNEVRALYFDDSSNLWIGTSGGLSLFEESSGTFINFTHSPEDPRSIPRGTVYAITKDSEGRLLVGTDQGGLASLDLKKAMFSDDKKVFTRSSISGTSANLPVRSLAPDSFGNIWIGSYGRGLQMLGNSAGWIRSMQYPSDLSSPAVTSLAWDSRGRMLAGNNAGKLDIIREGKPTKTEEDLTSSRRISAILPDSGGNIWAGTYEDGVYKIRPDGRREHISLGDNSADVEVSDLIEISDAIWTATNQGIFVINRATGRLMKHYTGEAGFEDNLVLSIARDRGGNIWVGTYGRGAFVFDPGMQLISSHGTRNGIPSNNVNDLMLDSSGAMWMATSEGLAHFSKEFGMFSHIYTRSDGLNNEFIRALAEDSEGNVWASTNSGVSCILKNGSIRNFDSRDGLPNGNFINGSVAVSPMGQICFGSTGGIGLIDPAGINSRRALPPVIFKNGTDEVTVSHRNNYLSVEFCVPDYSLASGVDYSYRIADLDPQWRQCEKELSFDHLPYGHHSLEVMARLRSTDSDSGVSTLKINVLPPFRASRIAIILYILAGIAAAASSIYFFLRHMRRESEEKFQRESLIRDKVVNEERMKFFTNITHELRTPLTLIIGPLDDLKDDRSLSADARSKISKVRGSAGELLTLINQILDFRKTETSNKKLSVCYSDFSSFVSGIGTKFRELTSNKNVPLITDIDSGIMMWFDPEAVTLMLNNLLSNARKYTPDGFIELSLHRTDDGNVTVNVTDSGIGMSDDEVSHIFDRYYQGNNNRQASGTGIGLALVKNLCDLHKVSIDVESQPGKGSIFSLTFDPAQTYPEATHIEMEEEPRPEAEAPLQESEGDGRPKVLVVEDNEGICSYIRESLEGAYRIDTAENGREGLRKAIKSIPDIIVSDIMMPVMDGIELCKAIKSDIRTSHIPVILLTARSTDEDRVHGYDVGADSYLVKPFNKDLVLSRIGNILSSRKALAAKVSRGEAHEELSRIDNEFLKKFTDLVEAGLASEKTDMASIARELCMSQSTLYRKLKGVTGLSPVEVVRNIRLDKAESLLKTTQLTISEIAWQVGMGSPVYLRDCFKERFGMTPSAYREKE